MYVLQAAEDFGGPRKEFLSLILREIKEKYFDDGLKTTKVNDYHVIGVIMGEHLFKNQFAQSYLREWQRMETM